MKRYDTFNKTIRGYLHGMKEIPCEDASVSFSAENGRYHMIAVADGHGDTACMRSALGARKVVEIAQKYLSAFALEVIDEQEVEGYKSIHEELAMAADSSRAGISAHVLASLTNTIISDWRSFVDEDIRQNPLSEEELAMAGSYEENYRAGNMLAHVYGTTLLAALMLPDFLILIQQGDGRCDVFYDDATVSQPIPWDDRCFENVTTSMCDEDVVTSIRSKVINTKNKRVIACFLGSDGVEDSFRSMEGTHMFYRNLVCELERKGKDNFVHFLDKMLPEFSKKGSGDDVSVGGIIDTEHIGRYVSMFQRQINQYDLREKLDRYEGRQISMSRKRQVLYERVRESERAMKELQKQRRMLDEDYHKKTKEGQDISDLAIEKEKDKQQLEVTLQKLSGSKQPDILPGISTDYYREMDNLNRKEIEKLTVKISKIVQHLQKLLMKKQGVNAELSQYNDKVAELEQMCKASEDQMKKARDEFEEYNQAYLEIGAEIDHIKKELAVYKEQKPDIIGELTDMSGQNFDKLAVFAGETQMEAAHPVQPS